MGAACCRDGLGFAAPTADGDYAPMGRSPQEARSASLRARGGLCTEGVACGLGIGLIEELSAMASSAGAPWIPIARWPGCVSRAPKLEALLEELFCLHDLDGNGTLEEEELVQLNAKAGASGHGRRSHFGSPVSS